MTGFLHRLSILLLALSLVTGGLAAQAIHAPADVVASPAQAAEVDTSTTHGCHDDPVGAADTGHALAGSPMDCCDHHGSGDTAGCALACAGSLAAVVTAPLQATAAVYPHIAPPAAPARGDPEYTPTPPRRPPIA